MNLKIGQTKIIAVNEEYFDNYADGVGYSKGYKHFGFNLPMMVAAYKRHNLMPKSILDCGAATGLTVRDMRQRGFQAYGIEIFKEAIDQAPAEVKPYVKQMDMRELDKFKADAFDSIYANSLMYLTEEEIKKFLDDAHKVAKQSIYLVNPFLDYSWTIPEDSDRKTLKPRAWWLNEVPNHGWEYCKGTEMLYRKV